MRNPISPIIPEERLGSTKAPFPAAQNRIHGGEKQDRYARMEPGFGIDDSGRIHPQHTEFILERARGEPGMIISGAMPVHPSGAADPATISMVRPWQDNVWPSLQEMVRTE